jgi:hypothetical protein
MAKNLCAKTRDKNDPYEIWQRGDWEWRILKKLQADDSKPYARAFCAVKSNFTYGEFELGDVYIADYKSVAVRVK